MALYLRLSLCLLTFTALLPDVQPVTIPLSVGEQQLSLVLEDWEDPKEVIKGMYSELERRISQEIETARSKPPDLEVPVVIDGEQTVLNFSVNDNIESSVANFAKLKGLDQEAAEQLVAQVRKRAVDAGLIPIFEHRFVYQDKELTFPVYAGKNPMEDIIPFAADKGIPQELFPTLKEQLKQALTAVGLMPLVSYNFQFGDQVLNFSLRSRENAAEKIADFAKKHGLNDDQQAFVGDKVRAILQAERYIPMNEVPVTLKQGDETKEHSIPLYAGDDVQQAVDRFAKKFDFSPEVKDKITEQVTLHAKAQGMLPVATFPVNVNGKKTAIPVFTDTNVTALVLEFGAHHALGESDVSELHSSIQNSLVDMGIAPLAEYAIDVDGRTTMLPVFRGDNITEKVIRFGAEHGIRQEDLPLLFQEIQKKLTTDTVRVTPVAELNVQWAGQPLVLRIYPGETVQQVVESFVAANGIPESAIDALKGEVSAHLVAQRLLPKIQLPVSIDGEAQMLALFQGDTAEQAASGFIEKHSLSPDLLPQFAAKVQEQLVQKGLVPMVRVAVALEEDAEEQALELFHGQAVPAAVDHFIAAHGLAVENKPRLERELERRAVAESRLPFARIPIVIDGKDVPLPLFVGQNITAAVHDFCTAHGVPTETIPKLLEAVQGNLKDLLRKVEGQTEPQTQ